MEGKILLMNILYKRAGIHDVQALTELTLRLYKDNTFESLLKENQELLSKENQIFFLAYNGDSAIGFAHCSLRVDYVEGTNGGTIGYLEGIYVQDEYRLQGIAKTLLIQCENWANENGCEEFASDCELDNVESYKFHLNLGFLEANRIISFAKKIHL